jgi:hypothetical protein
MPSPRHDQDFLKRLAKQTGKSPRYLRELASRRAGRLGISSPAALLLWAKEQGLSITRALNKLPGELREEVRSAQSVGPRAIGTGARDGKQTRPKGKRPRAIDAATINSILQDEQLRGRCKDLLLAKKHFDRVFREATTVLDDRLKGKSAITNMNPVNLVGKVVNPDPQKAVLVVSKDKDEQEGFHAICKGVMLGFRNPAHHSLTDRFSREDALKFCGFIDTILGAIDQAELHPERI